MSDHTEYAFLVQRWQQQAEEELLVETEWTAAQIASAVELQARDAMQQAQQEKDETP
jgi:hypothetical protein